MTAASAAPLGWLSILALFAPPAGADVVSCGLSGTVETTNVRLVLDMDPSSSGGYLPCPDESVLQRTDDTGETREIPVRWITDCSFGGHCCRYYVDECTPSGHLVYRLASACGSGGMVPERPAEVDRGAESCPAPPADAGCGCTAGGAPRRALELALFSSMLLVGRWALRRDRNAS
ncbi:MAG: hypothetical protein HY905_10580 [Deltaproteobacteria bacterium]|nr:hypothetical protein [Deltaproteobacteria bacterium]